MIRTTTHRWLALVPALALTACGSEPPDAGAGAARAPAAETGSAETAGTAVRYEVAAGGNEVRYLVQEQLAGFDLPNDAVGRTDAVRGGISLDDAGRVVAAESEFTIDVSGLRSDRDRRDGYVRRRILATDSNPTVTLRPTALRGAPAPLPAAGAAQFSLLGDLTVKGVTRPTTWSVDATFKGDTVSGIARTAFTFEEFQLVRPRVPIVLSVADTIRLEYAFRLIEQE